MVSGRQAITVSSQLCAASHQRTDPMFDHIMLRTQQFDIMTAFYEKALAPLGI